MYIFNRIWDLSQFFLGDLPTQFHFLYALFTFILSIVLIFVIFSPFIILIKLFNRWSR